jgi:hypothetical protein
VGQRAALILLGLCTAAALLGFCVDAAPLRWGAALAVATFPVALIALAAPRLRLPLLLLWIVLAGGFLLLMALPDGGPDAFLGLPLGTAVMLFWLVPVPFAIVCWAYAARFDLREEDLERLRRLRQIAEERRGGDE